jgi:Uma2 family endonuclease
MTTEDATGASASNVATVIPSPGEATVDDLYKTHDKAELVDGQLRIMEPTGLWPGRAGGRIYASLLAYERHTRSGVAVPDNVAFLVDLPHRKSFSPDAAFYTGPDSGMKFAQGAPVFAVEVRSEHDYGPRAESNMRRKRAEYFAAGTLVVWDVDPRAGTVAVFRTDPNRPAAVYIRGQMAEAEPAIMGWSMAVDEIFD